jgi:hypothetical protein
MSHVTATQKSLIATRVRHGATSCVGRYCSTLYSIVGIAPVHPRHADRVKGIATQQAAELAGAIKVSFGRPATPMRGQS